MKMSDSKQDRADKLAEYLKEVRDIDNDIAKELKKMQEAVHQGAMFVAGNSKDITTVQERQAKQDEMLKEMNKCLKEIKKLVHDLQAKDIAEVRLELARGKPSWSVTIIIAFLSSVAVGAIVFTLRALGGVQ